MTHFNNWNLAQEIFLDSQWFLFEKDIAVYLWKILQDLFLRQLAISSKQLQIEIPLGDLTAARYHCALINIFNGEAAKFLFLVQEIFFQELSEDFSGKFTPKLCKIVPCCDLVHGRINFFERHGSHSEYIVIDYMHLEIEQFHRNGLHEFVSIPSVGTWVTILWGHHKFNFNHISKEIWEEVWLQPRSQSTLLSIVF